MKSILTFFIFVLVGWLTFGCSKQSKQQDSVKKEILTIPIDSVKSVSTFLLHSTSNSEVYPLFECTIIDSTSIHCVAYNMQFEVFDTLKGYFSHEGALEVSNSKNSIQLRAAFKPNGLGQGVISTPTSTYFTELRLSNIVKDSIFEQDGDSIETIVNTSNSIEYQISYPRFKNTSASKIAIFTQFRKLSLKYLQQYTDSLNPQNTHFINFKAKCKKIGNSIWVFSWYRDSQINSTVSLFGLSFMDSSASLISSETIVNSIEPQKLPMLLQEVDKKKTIIDSVFPNSSYVELTENGIYVHREHQKHLYISKSLLQSYVIKDSFYDKLFHSIVKN